MFSLSKDAGISFSFGTTSSFPPVPPCQQGNKSSEGTKPDISLKRHFFKRLISFILMCTLVTQGHGTDTDAHFGSLVFDIMGQELVLTSTSEGRIMYTATLQRSRQIKAISRLIDFSELAIANTNVQHSFANLRSQDQMNQLDNFLFINGSEFHLSPTHMSYIDCGLHCATLDAKMVNDPTHVRTMIEFVNMSQIWVDTITSPYQVQGNQEYNVFLGLTMIYPIHQFSNPDSIIYFYNQGRRVPIPNIKQNFNYYDKHSATYWSTNPYKLHVIISKDLLVSILIPEKSYQAQCACVRLPTASSRSFSEFLSNVNDLNLQISAMDIGLEQGRIDRNNPQMGTLGALIFSFPGT